MVKLWPLGIVTACVINCCNVSSSPSVSQSSRTTSCLLIVKNYRLVSFLSFVSRTLIISEQRVEPPVSQNSNCLTVTNHCKKHLHVFFHLFPWTRLWKLRLLLLLMKLNWSSDFSQYDTWIKSGSNTSLWMASPSTMDHRACIQPQSQESLITNSCPTQDPSICIVKTKKQLTHPSDFQPYNSTDL